MNYIRLDSFCGKSRGYNIILDKTLVEEMYMCYNRTVNVPAKDAPEDEG